MTSVVITDEIRRVLELTKTCPGAPQSVLELALDSCNKEVIPWASLKAIVTELRRINQPELNLVDVCRGSTLRLESPSERIKCPELVARNTKYQNMLDNRSYDAMVADVTVKEREAEALKDSILPTARLQIGFGLQILVTKGTFFVLAYLGSKHFLGADELWAGLFGCLALTFGMLMEVTLYIIRTNRPQPLEERFPELFDKKVWGRGGTGVVNTIAGKEPSSKPAVADTKVKAEMKKRL